MEVIEIVGYGALIVIGVIWASILGYPPLL
jgi:energy-converting hydrogenase Eha subunit A